MDAVYAANHVSPDERASWEGPLEAVVFDYYETLAEINPEARAAMFDAVGKELGLRMESGELFERWLDLMRRRPWPRSNDAAPFRTAAQVWLERGEELGMAFGLSGAGRCVARHNAALHANARLYSDVADVVANLRRELRVGILSDADDDFLRASIATSGLEVDCVLSSEALQRYKPHVDTFRAICESLSVSAAATAFVGDGPLTDVVGAQDAGLMAIWMNRRGASWPQELGPPDLEVRSLQELEVQLRRRGVSC